MNNSISFFNKLLTYQEKMNLIDRINSISELLLSQQFTNTNNNTYTNKENILDIKNNSSIFYKDFHINNYNTIELKNLYNCSIHLANYNNKINIKGNKNTLEISKLENDFDIRNLDIANLKVLNGCNKKLTTSDIAYNYLNLAEVDLQNDIQANHILLRNCVTNANIDSSDIMSIETVEQGNRNNYFKNISGNKITLFNKDNSKTLNIIDYLSAELLNIENHCKSYYDPGIMFYIKKLCVNEIICNTDLIVSIDELEAEPKYYIKNIFYKGMAGLTKEHIDSLVSILENDYWFNKSDKTEQKIYVFGRLREIKDIALIKYLCFCMGGVFIYSDFYKENRYRNPELEIEEGLLDPFKFLNYCENVYFGKK